MTFDATLDIGGYVPTDGFFGAPYLDVDEMRASPSRHRFVHGGFKGTGTRFQFSFPEPGRYQGRFIQPLEGGLGGNENTILIGDLEIALGLGAYKAESNQGHIGSELCPKAGDDASVYGWRASAETGRLGKFLATQIYGAPPHHGYVYGGSGGGNRSAQCIENVHDVWEGALPFAGGGGLGGNPPLAPGWLVAFSTLFNAQRVLGSDLARVVDALEPGGSGDPYAGLSSFQRQALLDLYKSGFPRGSEWMIAYPVGQIGLWTWTADEWHAADPDYYEAFWTRPGYLGFDEPDKFAGDLIVETRARVKRVLTVQDLLEQPGGTTSPWVMMDVVRLGANAPVGVELDGVDGYLQGASLLIASGEARGRQLYCLAIDRGIVIGDGAGEAGNQRFRGVAAGDEILVDNRRYLAYSNRYRHVLNLADPTQQHMIADGRPIYPQSTVPPPVLSPQMGVFEFSGRFTGKVLHVQNLHDSSIWARGENVADDVSDRYVLRWTENAEHGPPSLIISQGPPAPNTRFIDYFPQIEQGLHDLVAWVEEGAAPAGTRYSWSPGEALRVPDTAAARGGIQAVVQASANGLARARVGVGDPVELAVQAEMPAGAGSIIGIEWDFDGAGTFPYAQPDVDGSLSRMTASVSHAYGAPGIYYPSVRVTSHRQGDVSARRRRVENLGRACVIVG